MGLASCAGCQPGWVTGVAAGANECTACATGKAAVAVQTVCTDCAVGKYSSGVGQESVTTCITCTAGKTVEQTGAAGVAW